MTYILLVLAIFAGITKGLTDLKKINNGTFDNGIKRSKNFVSYMFIDY
jgi:hypothetical protein